MSFLSGYEGPCNPGEAAKPRPSLTMSGTVVLASQIPWHALYVHNVVKKIPHDAVITTHLSLSLTLGGPDFFQIRLLSAAALQIKLGGYNGNTAKA